MPRRRKPALLPRLRRLAGGVRSLPPAALVLLLVALWAVADVAWQVARKPTELAGAVLPAHPRAPAATWEAYRHHFESHATGTIPAELLAALAQVESSGDPLARTYWRWQWSWNPLQLYRPASSAVGLLQITDGTFAEARRLCIHDHAVARDGPWYDPDSCWLNALYFRLLPGDAIEMTSARLHLAVEEALAARRGGRARPEDRSRLAAVIHLCGRERGSSFAGRGFRLRPGERCGDHELARYLSRVQELERAFAGMKGPRPPAPGEVSAGAVAWR
ncbi:MAG: transglycosylase SLT domain-containing protein [Deltaproteobacteria bacterium]|nr:transglycosylase SLT domain-containing protein [Deltaproteobacteria bacterium]